MNCYHYDEIQIGQEESFSFQITEEKVLAFRSMTGDINPLHTDTAYARSKGYQDKVVYGMLTASFLSTLAGVYLPGQYSLIHSVEVKFPNAAYAGSTVFTVHGKVIEKNDLFKLLKIKVNILNGNGACVCRGVMKVGVIDE
ncbi:MaoC/PaaZ C-terminal domain-containing protein [Harryflintia acetispora]|uniref:MaoC/PaaZ C-terminal domain-containing protein n=1 Tax=Harryflintia acetispora TaxID=1849041 RepID=UPI00189A41E9|nr:MaoC/PaaZ C-terminal domain-containing protein [Harryflintia acetispora]